MNEGMNKYLTLFFWAIALCLSCSPEIDILAETFRSESAVISDKGQITVLFDERAGTATIDLKASKRWNCEFTNGRANWCTLSTDYGGRGTITLIISVCENNDFSERNASITFTCDDVEQTIIIIQKQKDAVLISSSRLEVPESGGVYTIDVRHNIDYTVSLDEYAMKWISIFGTKTLETNTITLQVSANESVLKREGNLIIKSDIGEEVIKLYQEGATPILVLTQNNYVLSDEGGTIAVEIRSNVNFNYKICEGVEWINDLETKSMSTHTLNFVIRANETYDNRTGSIIFSDSETGLTDTVTILQKQKDALFLTQNEYVVPSEGDIISVYVKSNSNFEYEIRIGDEWISELKTKGLNSHVIQFEVEPNESYEIRSGKILFTLVGTGLSEEVSILQLQKDVILVDSREIDISPSGGAFSVTIKSNVNASICIPDSSSWIRQIQTKGLSDHAFTFEAEKNDSREERKGAILFKYLEICDTVIVCQPIQPIVISDKTLYFSGRGSMASFKTATNKVSDYRIEISDSWLSVERQQQVSGGIEYILSAQENPASFVRESFIKVFYRDFSEPDTIKAIQMEKYPTVTFTTRNTTVMAPTLFGPIAHGFIAWGDGTSEAYSPGVVHRYSKSGEHIVSIEAIDFRGIQLPVENQVTVNFKELSK